MSPVRSDPSTRREFLALSASVAAGAALPMSRQHRPRHSGARRGLQQVQHVVIVMQENCSFDRYFGTLRGVRGFSDPHALKLPGGRSVFYQPSALPPGYLLPWHLDSAKANPCEIPIDNSWDPMHKALDGGKMDGWVSAEGTRAGGPVIDNGERTPYTWTTYPERLQRHGISWRVYQQTDNFDDNALAWFKQYQQAQPGSPLYENGMRRRSAGAFAEDVAAGRLPSVSWVISPTAQSEHPGYAPGPGADFCNQMQSFLQGFSGSGGLLPGLAPAGKPTETPFFMSSDNGQQQQWTYDHGVVLTGVGTAANGQIYVGLAWGPPNGQLASNLFLSLSPL
jgi:phospholipase C